MRILGQLALYSVVGLPSFNPIIQNNIRGDRSWWLSSVSVVYVHMALQFLNSRGCEITVFSANSEKEKDARKLRAHNFLNSRDPVE